MTVKDESVLVKGCFLCSGPSSPKTIDSEQVDHGRWRKKEVEEEKGSFREENVSAVFRLHLGGK